MSKCQNVNPQILECSKSCSAVGSNSGLLEITNSEIPNESNFLVCCSFQSSDMISKKGNTELHQLCIHQQQLCTHQQQLCAHHQQLCAHQQLQQQQSLTRFISQDLSCQLKCFLLQGKRGHPLMTSRKFGDFLT